ncbi:PRELI-like family-domain-containing protein [Gorgonomyces haynaldii]|nr:PRELI-like family-domain-containing protein [Gorgonomyces haynaldii]
MLNYSQSNLYNHHWDKVTAAIWLKYQPPNPFSTHVLSADVIDRTFDPKTGILTTTRLVLKKNRVPIPQWAQYIISSQNAYVLEQSTVNVKTKEMKIVSRNLSHKKLMVIEETQTITQDKEHAWIRVDARFVSNLSLVKSAIEDFCLNRFKNNLSNVVWLTVDPPKP